MKHTQAHIAHLILTYHEGTLNPTEKIELEALLLENPSLALDLEEQPSLIAPPIQIDSTSFLHPLLEDLEIYKDEEGHPLEKLAIGNFEGELNEQEQKIVHSYTQDTLYQKIEQELAHTKLVADQTIQYPQLNKLLKTAPVRQLNWRPYVMVGSSAAAVLLAVFMMGHAHTNVNSNQTKSRQQARVVSIKKSTQSQKTPLKSPLVESFHSDQVAIHPHVVGEPPRDCIVPLLIPSLEVPQEINMAQVPIGSSSNGEDAPIQNQSEVAAVPSTHRGAAFDKAPVTIKSFLLQKTNEKLFGTAAPSTDLKFETLARYASESVGIPVRYQVEEAQNQDKLVFQLGPITIEKTRSRK
jgi:hypothetical protein